MDADDPRHGTYRGWAQHKRDWQDEKRIARECPPCHEARKVFQRRRKKLHEIGRPPRVPIGATAWRKLRQLRDAGCSFNEIAEATGMSASTCTLMLQNGPRHVAQRKHRDSLRMLDVEAYLSQRLTHVGTVRRARALMRIGYTGTAVAMAAGLHAQAVELILRGTSHSRWTTRRKIAHAYELLHMHPLDGTHDRIVSRAINKARRAGFAPPLAWDDIDHDEGPQGVEDECVLVDRADQLADMAACGVGRAEAARRIGVQLTSLERWCERHGYGDVWEAMAS